MGESQYNVYIDGNVWCATAGDFVNIQESNIGFGKSPVMALKQLLEMEDTAEQKRCEGMRKWQCNNCQYKFLRGKVSSGIMADCPKCTAGNQYTYEIEGAEDNPHTF